MNCLGFLTRGMRHALCVILSLPQNNQIINQPTSQPTNQRTNQPISQPTSQLTNQPASQIAEIKAKEGAFIATIDVDSLYTNIDDTNGLEAVKQIFNKNPDPKRPDKEILEPLKNILENNDFEFNS